MISLYINDLKKVSTFLNENKSTKNKIIAYFETLGNDIFILNKLMDSGKWSFRNYNYNKSFSDPLGLEELQWFGDRYY